MTVPCSTRASQELILHAPAMEQAGPASGGQARFIVTLVDELRGSETSPFGCPVAKQFEVPEWGSVRSF